MKSYLLNCKSSLARRDAWDKLSLVLGNESCDLDSAVSSIVYAYFMSKAAPSKPSSTRTLVIPVLSIDCADYELRTEVVFWLDEICGITREYLIFQDQVPWDELVDSGRLGVVLIDHNQPLARAGRDMGPWVTQVIDHHQPGNWVIPESIPSVIESVGSCSTLVAREMLTRDAGRVDVEMCELLRGAIIMDTICFDESAGKSTPEDLAVVLALEAKIGVPSSGSGRENVYKRLLHAKTDVSKLSTEDVLRKDLKSTANRYMTIAVSSVPLHLQEFLSRDVHVEQNCFEFLAKYSFNVLVLMGAGQDAAGCFQRSLGVLAEQSLYADQVLDLLLGDVQLNLALEFQPAPAHCPRVACFQQGNAKASRKVILPALSQFLNAVVPESPPPEPEPSTTSNDASTSQDDVAVLPHVRENSVHAGMTGDGSGGVPSSVTPGEPAPDSSRSSRSTGSQRSRRFLENSGLARSFSVTYSDLESPPDSALNSPPTPISEDPLPEESITALQNWDKFDKSQSKELTDYGYLTSLGIEPGDMDLSDQRIENVERLLNDDSTDMMANRSMDKTVDDDDFYTNSATLPMSKNHNAAFDTPIDQVDQLLSGTEFDGEIAHANGGKLLHGPLGGGKQIVCVGGTNNNNNSTGDNEEAVNDVGQEDGYYSLANVRGRFNVVNNEDDDDPPSLISSFIENNPQRSLAGVDLGPSNQSESNDASSTNFVANGGIYIEGTASGFIPAVSSDLIGGKIDQSGPFVNLQGIDFSQSQIDQDVNSAVNVGDDFDQFANKDSGQGIGWGDASYDFVAINEPYDPPMLDANRSFNAASASSMANSPGNSAAAPHNYDNPSHSSGAVSSEGISSTATPSITVVAEAGDAVADPPLLLSAETESNAVPKSQDSADNYFGIFAPSIMVHSPSSCEPFEQDHDEQDRIQEHDDVDDDNENVEIVVDPTEESNNGVVDEADVQNKERPSFIVTQDDSGENDVNSEDYDRFGEEIDAERPIASTLSMLERCDAAGRPGIMLHSPSSEPLCQDMDYYEISENQVPNGGDNALVDSNNYSISRDDDSELEDPSSNDGASGIAINVYDSVDSPGDPPISSPGLEPSPLSQAIPHSLSMECIAQATDWSAEKKWDPDQISSVAPGTPSMPPNSESGFSDALKANDESEGLDPVKKLTGYSEWEGGFEPIENREYVMNETTMVQVSSGAIKSAVRQLTEEYYGDSDEEEGSHAAGEGEHELSGDIDGRKDPEVITNQSSMIPRESGVRVDSPVANAAGIASHSFIASGLDNTKLSNAIAQGSIPNEGAFVDSGLGDGMENSHAGSECSDEKVAASGNEDNLMPGFDSDAVPNTAAINAHTDEVEGTLQHGISKVVKGVGEDGKFENGGVSEVQENGLVDQYSDLTTKFKEVFPPNPSTIAGSPTALRSGDVRKPGDAVDRVPIPGWNDIPAEYFDSGSKDREFESPGGQTFLKDQPAVPNKPGDDERDSNALDRKVLPGPAAEEPMVLATAFLTYDEDGPSPPAVLPDATPPPAILPDSEPVTSSSTELNSNPHPAINIPDPSAVDISDMDTSGNSHLADPSAPATRPGSIQLAPPIIMQTPATPVDYANIDTPVTDSEAEFSPDTESGEDVDPESVDGTGEQRDLEWEHDTSLDAEAGTSTRPTPLLDAERDGDAADGKQFRSVTVAGEKQSIDLEIIAPYKQVISHGGYYGDGLNAIIIFAACYLPDRSLTERYSLVMDHLFLYVVNTLDQLVAEDYVIVFLQGGTHSRAMPSLGWLRRCYQLLDRRHVRYTEIGLDQRLRKNLKALFLVHPTFWLKTVVTMSKPFMSSKFSQKIRFVANLNELSTILPVDQLGIPDSVKDYDREKRIVK